LDRARADEALRVLDEVEDEGEMYQRIVIEVATDDGVVSAHAYQYLLDVDAAESVGSVWPREKRFS
jgi:hypothetical protein